MGRTVIVASQTSAAVSHTAVAAAVDQFSAVMGRAVVAVDQLSAIVHQAAASVDQVAAVLRALAVAVL